MPVSPFGFEAWIEMEGKRLEEFKVVEEDGKLVCWVPCEAGKVRLGFPSCVLCPSFDD